MYECVNKYTFATVSLVSVNNTEYPTIGTFEQSLIVSDSHFNVHVCRFNSGCSMGMKLGTKRTLSQAYC